MLGKLPVPGRPTILIIVGQGLLLGLFGHFYSHQSFLSSFSLFLGDGPVQTEILSQRPLNPKPTNNYILLDCLKHILCLSSHLHG